MADWDIHHQSVHAQKLKATMTAQRYAMPGDLPVQLIHSHLGGNQLWYNIVPQVHGMLSVPHLGQKAVIGWSKFGQVLHKYAHLTHSDIDVIAFIHYNNCPCTAAHSKTQHRPIAFKLCWRLIDKAGGVQYWHHKDYYNHPKVTNNQVKKEINCFLLQTMF
jgi:hypothetical protein